MRFITCGSVDDGKSTLIGRLLADHHQIPEGQLASLEKDSRQHGTQGNEIDFALLLDGLAAEREQGITIDVAYRFFATAQRRYIVADTPGHEQYTRNMITGASTADAAIVLADARHGVLTQTRRHTYLAALMGVRHVVLAVNKMDLVDYGQTTFEEISAAFHQFASSLGFASITAIPLSALKGDNLTLPSQQMPWYAGLTLIASLDALELDTAPATRPVFPVQWVNRPDQSFRGLAGSVSGGALHVNDAVRCARSGQTANIARIVTMDGDLEQAAEGRAVTLVLDRALDIPRGEVLSPADDPIETTDQFEATLIWLHQEPGLVGRSYEIKLATQSAAASITVIKHRVNINTLAHEPARALQVNDVAVCKLALSLPLAFDTFTNSKTLGGFILIDRLTRNTIAAGLVRHNLRRAQNVHRQALSVTRPERERLNGHSGRVIWFTGLSGSGKSTLANALEVKLHAAGIRTYLLDGDNVRQGLNRDLGFTDADRVENIRRIAEVARLMQDAGLVVITAFIAPFRAEREMARELIGADHFVEVYVSTPLAVCEARDPKGLYKKARSGLLPNLSGVGSAYDVPEQPALAIDTSAISTEDAVVALLRLSH